MAGARIDLNKFVKKNDKLFEFHNPHTYTYKGVTMGLADRIKKIVESRKLPDIDKISVGNIKNWKLIKKAIATEESRLKALVSQNQSLKEKISFWRKTANEAINAGKTGLFNEAREKENVLILEFENLLTKPEESLERLNILKKTIERLEDQGKAVPTAMRGGTSKPGSDAYLIRLNERIKLAENHLKRINMDLNP